MALKIGTLLAISAAVYGLPLPSFLSDARADIQVSSPSSTAQTAVAPSDFPDEAIEILSRHSTWETIHYFGGQAGGQALLLPPKVWERSYSTSLKPVLHEVTKLSLREDPAQPGKIQWYSESIDTGSAIQAAEFGFDFPKYANSSWVFKQTGEDQFSLKSSDGFLTVIFIPADSEPNGDRFIIHGAPPENSYAATAPLGFNDLAFVQFGITAEPTSYLHHDPSRPKKVRVSANFPKRYYSAVIEDLKKWNEALGFELFNLNLQSGESVDPIDCYSNDLVCLIWNGGEDLPWTGLSANTTISYNPISGRIIGGMIFLRLGAPAGSLIPTPAEITAKVSSSDPGLSWVVEQSLKTEEFSKYSHPYPEALLQYFVVHELGHYVGLKHNFAGSLRGTFAHPTDAIMDYLPFPVTFKATYIGDYDRSMLALVYGGKVPNSNQPYCSDLQLDGDTWAPYCDQRDLGDTLEWYGLLAGLSSDGLFVSLAETSVTNSAGYVQQSLLDVLIRYLKTPSREAAEKVICSHMTAKAQSYLEQNHVTTFCDNKVRPAPLQ